MKKLIFSACIIAMSLLGHAQSFHRGALVIDFNTGLDFYNVNYSYKLKNLAQSYDTSITNGAANHNFSLGVELGLGKHFGVGIRGKSNTFFTEVDKVTQSKPSVKSTDLMLMLNIHPIVRKHFDLILGADVGLSKLNYQAKDSANTVIKGSGSYVSVYLNPRVYIGRFGFNLKAFVPFVNYNDLKSNNDFYNNYVIAKWKASGFGASIGIQLRLF